MFYIPCKIGWRNELGKRREGWDGMIIMELMERHRRDRDRGCVVVAW